MASGWCGTPLDLNLPPPAEVELAAVQRRRGRPRKYTSDAAGVEARKADNRASAKRARERVCDYGVELAERLDALTASRTTLVEGMDPSTLAAVTLVVERQREALEQARDAVAPKPLRVRTRTDHSPYGERRRLSDLQTRAAARAEREGQEDRVALLVFEIGVLTQYTPRLDAR